MILQLTQITVREGTEADFAAALNDGGLALLRGGAGCRSVRMARGVESPSTFVLLHEWDSIPAHEAFIAHDDHQRFVAIIKPYMTGATMEHYDLG
jgi:quinol monooxygenase YgiN